MSNHPVTHHDLEALERRMSALADAVAKLTASVQALDARVTAHEAEHANLKAEVPTQADLDAIAAATAKIDGTLAPAPTTTEATQA